MKLEIDVKFNIGDKVLVVKIPGYSKAKPFRAIVSGYAIDVNNKKTVVRYLVDPIPETDYREYNDIDGPFNLFQNNSRQHKRRYGVNCLKIYTEE